MSVLGKDLRFALRTMRRTPTASLAAILAIALGVGATTAIFTIVNSVLLRPLPYPDSDSLLAVHVGSARNHRCAGVLSYPEYQDLAVQSRTLETVGAWTDSDANLTARGASARVLVRLATPSLLRTLQIEPIRGRQFLNEEGTRGRDHVALVSYALWRGHFGGAEDILGKQIRLDGVDFEVVGVLPRGFTFDKPVDLWVPMAPTDESFNLRSAHFLRVIGRRHPGVSQARIKADLDAFAKRQSEDYSDVFPPSFGFTTCARPYGDEVVSKVRLPILILLGAVSIVLVIACANVANLLMAIAISRRREMALRAALGASRRRLIRQLLTEGLLLSTIGATVGLAFAILGVDALTAASPQSLPRVAEITIDVRVLLFTIGMACCTGVGISLIPAIAASRPNLRDGLQDGMGGTRGNRSLRKMLVVAEVVLSLILLVGGGLLLRSFLYLRGIDPGFRPDGALMLRVSLPVPENISDTDRDHFATFYLRATARLRQLPGVSAVGASTILPLDGTTSDRLFEIEGSPPLATGDQPSAEQRHVTSGWFAAMGIPIVRGRPIEVSDDRDAPRVAIINQSFARKFFANGDPIGKRLRVKGVGGADSPWTTIVGICSDVHGYGLHAPPRPEMYFSIAQTRESPWMGIIVRTMNGDATALAMPARAAIAEIDPLQPVFDVQPLEQLVSTSLAERRFTLLLLLVFAGAALVLAVVGIYGVMANSVEQRARELGIRVALGATPANVLGAILRDGLAPVVAGLLIGTGAALALARLLSSILYGISTADVVTYVVAAAIILLVGLAAIMIPARRAMRVDPMIAMRSE